MTNKSNPQRKPKQKSIPSLTPDQIAAQVSARIAQLSQPVPKTTPSVKVKSHAELQSSKIARLTTKIAVTEVEIQRLKREQMKAQEAVQRSLEVQRSAALAILERKVALEKAIQESGGGNDDGLGHGHSHVHGEYKNIEGLRGELETTFREAKEALANGRPEDVSHILGSDSLLTRGVRETGENVMGRVLQLFEKMERDVKEGTVSDGARMVLDALAQKPVVEAGRENDNGPVLEALATALSLEEGKGKVEV